VNWPKLNTPPWALDNYQDSLASVSKDPIIGPFVEEARKSRSSGVQYMEEGKKRVE
jgi:hypothetical protein